MSSRKIMSVSMIAACFVSALLAASSCVAPLPGAESWKKGVLTVSFDLSGSKDARVIADDFTKVASGTVFLKQGGVIKKQANLTIDVGAKTGSATLTDILTGNYDIVLELNDTVPKLLYDAVSTVTIVAGNNGVKTMELSKNIGTLSLAGSWAETISDLVTATAELKQSGTTIYATSLSLNIDGKTVGGSISNVYPGTYELYMTIMGTGGILKFDGTKSTMVSRGTNTDSISPLSVKTGSVAINVIGDATAPAITSGPSYTISGTTATITWTTNEPATSLVCYSETSGFDYRSSLNWAPLGGDLTADTTNHSVVVESLTEGATYYYVVVSGDASGNLMVSDEEFMVISEIPQVGLVGEWLFSGNPSDTSGHLKHGTVYGASLTDDRFNLTNKAYSFDGSDDRIEILETSSYQFPSMTLCVWAKDTNETLNHGEKMIFAKHTSTIHQGYFIETAYGVYILYKAEGSTNITTPISDFLWHFIVGINNNGIMKLYIDGSLLASGSYSYMPENLNNIVFGNLSAGGYAWKGSIDDVRIYNRALSDNEIVSLYHEGGW